MDVYRKRMGLNVTIDNSINSMSLTHSLSTQNYERVLRDLVKQNADLKSRVQAKDKDLAKAQQQLRHKVK